MFEWDRAKAAANLLKHEVSFEETRFLRIGESVAGRGLIVAYTERRRDNEEVVRIISSRQASKKERTFYRQSP